MHKPEHTYFSLSCSSIAAARAWLPARLITRISTGLPAKLGSSAAVMMRDDPPGQVTKYVSMVSNDNPFKRVGGQISRKAKPQTSVAPHYAQTNFFKKCAESTRGQNQKVREDWMTRDEAIELIRKRHQSILDVLDEINRRTLNGEFDGPGKGKTGSIGKVDRLAQGEATIRLVIEKFSKGKGRE
jgi:hypothetical protein